MHQRSLDLAYVNHAFRNLAARAGWQAYHTPKNIAAAVAVEAAELLEIFQWLNDEQLRTLVSDADFKTKVADEVADVTMYLVELCAQLDIDMVAAVTAKIAKNEERLIAKR